ncbi:MAG: outer membrane protein assembly factor BamA [Candidatus Zixiibacteriota bacterium]
MDEPTKHILRVSMVLNRFCFLTNILVAWLLLSLPALASNQKKPIIEKIAVGGNNYFSEDKIKDQMSLKENRWYNLLGKRRYNPKKAELDQASIDSLYHVNGFLAADCQISAAPRKEQSCVVEVQIKEGVQIRLGSVALEGGLPELEEKTRKELKPLNPGTPFNWTRLYGTVFNIKSIYANNAYPYAEVQILLPERTDSSVQNVTFKVSQDKKVYFGKMSFEGLKLTREKVARRELTIKEGEPYSREKIMDSQQRIFSTGLFSYLTLKAKDVEQKPEKPDFVLRVIEKKPNYVGTRMELAQNQPQPVNQQEYLTVDFTGEWGNRNLAGTSRKIGLSGFYSYEIVPKIQRLSNRLALTYTEPWFLETRTLLGLDLYYEPGVQSAVQEYRIESYGGNLNLSREYKEHTKMWLTYSYQQVKIYSIPPEVLETYKREQGINVRRKIILSGERDTRSNIFIPLDGSFVQVYSELVGGFMGGDNNFYEFTFSWSRYNHLGRRKILNVLATRIKLGYAEELTRHDYVPTFDRFYMGGASSMRGYKENSMGPVDAEGVPTGGKVMMLGNLEYRRALFWKLGYAVFVDAGNLWEEVKEIKVKNVKLTSGLSMQFFTPVGPLRLDYGRQLPIRQSPQSGRFHLSILYAF